MKITDIKVFPIWVGSRNQCVIKVETDEGIYGLGEAGCHGESWQLKALSGTIASFWWERTRCRSVASGRRCTAASTSKVAACW